MNYWITYPKSCPNRDKLRQYLRELQYSQTLRQKDMQTLLQHSKSNILMASISDKGLKK